jgi:hypothetical protein
MMIRLKVIERRGEYFVLADGSLAKQEDPPMIDDEVEVEGGIIKAVHRMRTKFGHDNRQEWVPVPIGYDGHREPAQ